MDELFFDADRLEMEALTFKSIHASLLLEGLLLALVWNALGIFSDAANWLDFELRVLCCCGFILDLIGRVVDFALWLAFDECCCRLRHFLLL